VRVLFFFHRDAAIVMLADDAEGKSIWIDCDPGHDDALALLLAFFATTSTLSDFEKSDLQVLGVSTTHGNATGGQTYFNAVRLLSAYGVDSTKCKVWRGCDTPLLRGKKQDEDIHGNDGLGGVQCLPNVHDSRVQRHLDQSGQAADPLALIQHQIALLHDRRRNRLPPISLVATGPLTNVALLLKMCPTSEDGEGESMTLLRQTIGQIVIMGGAAATSGNRSPTAEWNILVDPEAASIVFDSPIPVVMAGLNVTHQAIFTTELQEKLMGDANDASPSPLRRLVHSAVNFFGSTYKTVFGFQHGPPIHDMLAVAYVLDPSLFYRIEPRQHGLSHDSNNHDRLPCARYRVHVDTSHTLTAGTTIVDYYGQWPVLHDSWHRGGKNVVILEYVDVRSNALGESCLLY
jgi:uridine nucleosidase